MVYCNHIPRAVVLDWGCAIELDDIGLPATPNIHHVSATCLCTGRQDELLLKQLNNWLMHDAELLQIEPRCAAVTIVRLIDQWSLGTANWLAGLQESVKEWKEELVQKATPNNPLVKARIQKRRKRNPKLRPARPPSAAELSWKARWCEDEEY